MNVLWDARYYESRVPLSHAPAYIAKQLSYLFIQ